ncbi:hypothetical protein [Acetobacter orleanensis]|uniref:Glycosyl transferase n=1 Tax=Acetobacter orleanensis TaxID=104099 RepID=A0A4Y3TMN1_9PROT|nr:hypothetical protein [Acetobacter orleanensis]KXV65402.1 hypothetical protein AD949_04680 [Acetobacter orleanensis]PCD80122.1 hypothetical protein CO710_04585 [Acetobacter orleanensis]GAN68466.1 hypothetical protein Abol_015_305 [Acetobacter orleanensis JCM 7639]GBR22840.1 hypothetical protein AA0473_0228 [Acetobacter orleanensis NRIC 0473]GEB82689.1 hypothetical protein AOR01nite_11660 [Acetobacter orleanensis]
MTAKVFIATPCFGGLVTQVYMQSVLGCLSTAQDHNLAFSLCMMGNDAVVCRGRNTLLDKFMNYSDATHILFVDNDIGFEPDAPARLVAAGKDVVAGLYPLKERYWDGLTTAQIMRGETPATASLRYTGETEKLHETPAAGGTLITTAFSGAGFMLITREAIQRMSAFYPETRYNRIEVPTQSLDAALGRPAEHPDDGGGAPHALFDCTIDEETGAYMSEDFTFCKRWRAMGGEVWLDTSLVLSHSGMAQFSGNPALRLGIALPDAALFRQMQS